MKVAMVKPPNKGNEVRGVGFYAERLMTALQKLPNLEISWVSYTQNPYTYQKYDIVHFPYFDPFQLTLPPVRVSRTIVTVHDLIPLKFPARYPHGKKAKVIWPIQKKILQGVDAIITDSHASKRDIGEMLKFKNENIFVTHLAADPAFHKMKNPKNKFNLPEKFALYVGGVNWNKNVISLLKAATDLDINLVLVGKEFLTKPTDHVELLPLKEMQPFFVSPKIKPIGFIETDDLVELFNLATVYVQPSIYEGFGLPVLEALACGTPVICGQGGSLAEITGDAVIVVDVEKSTEIARAIEQVFAFTQNQREEQAEKAVRQAAKFSWAVTASETLAAYENALKS